MTAPDLHGKIRAEVERRLAVARAADLLTSTWYTADDLSKSQKAGGAGLCAEDAEFMVLHDPADAIRRYEYALKVLDRHQGYQIPAGHKWAGSYNCERCNGMVWPCTEVADLATSLGVEVSS